MQRTIALAAVLGALAAGIAACGSSDGGDGSATSGGSATRSMPANTTTTVATERVDGVGTVLVDAGGMALYTPEQEASGTIGCTGSCAGEWIPLRAGATRPTGAGDTGALAVIRRPDGVRQVTAGGRPLYTFAEDSRGEVTGNGETDSFDGRSFTWHAMLAGGTPATGDAGGSTTGSGGSGESQDDAGGSYGGGY